MKSLVRSGLLLFFAWAAAGAAGAAVPAPVVSYVAPAGGLPAGHLHGQTYDAVLPSGRLVTPVGTSVVVGMNALGLALSPDGRYAVVGNDDERGAAAHSAVDPQTSGGYSLTVVDTVTMAVVDRYRAPGLTLFGGLVVVPDPEDSTRALVLAPGGATNAVEVIDLDRNGRLGGDRVPAIPLAPGAPAVPGGGFPAAIVASRDGTHAYVVSELGSSVAAIDVGRRALIAPPAGVGFRPGSVALAGERLLVTDEGLMSYAPLPAPAAAPRFAQPPADLQHASALSLLGLRPDGTLTGSEPPAVPMDPAPDGLATVGGAHPSAIVATSGGAYAFVAMANVDRVATVELGLQPHVVGGIELRLFDRGPYGTQPTALALSRDGSRLYVALTGLDAIAVIDSHDPQHLHRLGLIPTGWAPSAVALAPDDRTLFVANARGFGNDNSYTADADTAWSTLQKIDLTSIRLADSTRATLADTRRVVSIPPKYPKAIRNVVLVLEQPRTFDAALGALGYGPVNPDDGATPESRTPNLYALARRFAVAGNFFADADTAAVGHQFVNAGVATDYTFRHAAAPGGRGPFGVGQNPEDYPRFGYLFHALARHNVSFRDYGELLQEAGYVPAATAADDPGLGGAYWLDVPAPAVLAGHVDLRYPGNNGAISDEHRADEFIRDYTAAGPPRFAAVWLPGGDAADDDTALGKIVASLSRLPSWSSSAIIVMPVASAGRDHVDQHRTFALIVSPYAKSRYVGMRHTSTASVLKTIDGIFGLPPLSLGDLLATDMSDFFRLSTSDARPYEATAVPGRT